MKNETSLTSYIILILAISHQNWPSYDPPDIFAKGTKLAVSIVQTEDHHGNSDDTVVPANNKQQVKSARYSSLGQHWSLHPTTDFLKTFPPHQSLLCQSYNQLVNHTVVMVWVNVWLFICTELVSLIALARTSFGNMAMDLDRTVDSL